MSQTYVFVPKEEAERVGVVPNQAINVYTFVQYAFQNTHGFPFTPSPNGDLFRTPNDAEKYSNIEKDRDFVKILVYSGS